MKKHSLFKSMAIILLLVLVLTYILPDRTNVTSVLPLGDMLTNCIQAYYYFFDTLVFILVVGALYGVLNKIGGYKKLLNAIVRRVKSHSKLFILISVIAFALVVALTGITTPLIVIIPFIISIILLLGYDKLVAITATIVPTMIGFIGGISSAFRDPNNYYGYSTITFDEFVGIDKWSNLIPQLALLVIGIVLTVLFINKHIKQVENKKAKYELTKKELIAYEETEEYKDTKSWPLLVVLAILMILLILGLTPWSNTYGFEVFNKFHTWINELSIKDVNVFPKIISSTFPAFGSWGELGTYIMEIVVILIAILVIKLIYKIKFNDLINYISEGAKKLLPIATLMMLAYAILVCVYNNGFIETIITKASNGGEINFVLASIISIIGSIFHVDIYYTAAGVFAPILQTITNESMLNVYALAFQSLYGLTSLVGPTSIMLIFGLSYLDIPYTTWLKYIWRFILSLFIVIFATLLILTLI